MLFLDMLIGSAPSTALPGPGIVARFKLRPGRRSIITSSRFLIIGFALGLAFHAEAQTLSLNCTPGANPSTQSQPATAGCGVPGGGLPVFDLVGLVRAKNLASAVSQSLPPKITTASPLPEGTVGQSYVVPLAAAGGAPPYRWEVATGALPLGLALNSQTGGISGTPELAGNSDFTVLLRDAAGGADTESFRLHVQGNPNLPPDLEFEPKTLRTQFTRQPSRVDTQVRVLNRGGGTVSFNVFAETNSGGDWLTVSPERVDASPEAPGVVSVSLLPPAAGTAGCSPNGCFFVGAIVFQPLDGGPPERIRVLAGVSRRDDILSVAPQGLTFTGRSGGPRLPAQTVRVRNIGSGVLPWNAVVTTLSGGSNWLIVNPNSGSAGQNSGAESFTVEIDPAGLAAGVHYGRIEVLPTSNSGASRLITVIANIMAPAANIDPLVEPSGLVFTSTAGGPQPPTQPVFVFNPSSASLSFDALLVAEVRGETAARSFPGLVVQAGQRLQLDVASVFSPQLERGIYHGFMKLTFAGGFSETVSLTLIVAPSQVISLKLPLASQGACQPTALSLEVTGGLSQVFNTFPTDVRVRVLDDCNNPVTQGTVSAQFASGDVTLLTNFTADGSWRGTLTVRSMLTPNSVTIDANTNGSPPLSGSVTKSFRVGAAAELLPNAPSEAIVGGANGASQPLAPGSIFSVYGVGLSNSQSGAEAPSLPLPTKLGGTQLFFARAGLCPIMFSGILPGLGYDQVNAITPYAISGYTGDHLDFIVTRDNVQSATPVSVSVGEFQPGIFTQSGKGFGAASITHHLDNSYVTAENQAVPGENIAIAVTGLGEVTPDIEDGHSSCEPNGVCLIDGSNVELRTTVTKPTVTIGGVELPPEAVQFAGLYPSFAGLHQMNVRLPPDMPKLPLGEQEIIVTIGGEPSRKDVFIYIKDANAAKAP